MWKTINRVLDRSASATSISSLNIDGRIVTGEREVAEALNQHFVTIGSKLNWQIKSKASRAMILFYTKLKNHRQVFILIKSLRLRYLMSCEAKRMGKQADPIRYP